MHGKCSDFSSGLSFCPFEVRSLSLSFVCLHESGYESFTTFTSHVFLYVSVFIYLHTVYFDGQILLDSEHFMFL